MLQRFMSRHVPRTDGDDLYGLYRLLLPREHDERERGNYNLKV